MTRPVVRWIFLVASAVLAAAIFALDCTHALDVIPILYLAVLGLVAGAGRVRDVLGATLVCILLTVAAEFTGHGGQLPLEEVSSLVLAGLAIGCTGGLLAERIRTRTRLQALTDILEQHAADGDAERTRIEARYSSLFDVSNITFAEMDFSATHPVLDRLRAAGVTDIRAYFGAHPDEFEATLALIRTTRVNEALARMMGYADVAELVANPPAVNADDGPEVLLRQLEMAYYGQNHIDGRTVLIGKGGIEIPVYFTVNRLAEGLHLSSHLDLTEQERIEELRRAAQDELARANRVATVGAFSASIAHELNQPISSMVMNAQTGLRWLERDPPDLTAAAQILERLARTAQRIAGIVQRTRDSIMAGRRRIQPIDLRELATETGDLLEREMRRAEILFEILCDDPPPIVEGDPVELQQVLVNLVNNAAEAMQGQAGDRRITLSIAQAQDGVTIMVADNGPGISEENLLKLFQPFFTTKPTGIGMGLQICRSAVEAMGGRLTATNRHEGGACFSFTLPSQADMLIAEPVSMAR